MSLVLGAMLTSTALGAAGEPDIVQGSRTRLQIARLPPPFPPTLSGGLGKTQLRLWSTQDGRDLLKETREGRWSCLGFSEADRSFILGVANPRGAWIPLVSIQRLREDGSWAPDSAFDREQYLALAAVVSPTQRFVVFVGGRHGVEGLCVLDLKLDTVRVLGRPPAPPPAPYAASTCGAEPFRWGTCWADGFVDMDAGILRFPSADVLEVSHGRDSAWRRSRNRRVQRFSLLPGTLPPRPPKAP